MPSASNTSTEGNEALLKAGKTALATVDGAVTPIDDEDQGTRWEIDGTTADGTVNELEISADGKEVVRGLTPNRTTGTTRPGTARVSQTPRSAFGTRSTSSPERRPVASLELELDSHHGKTVWEADVGTSQTKTEVKIDASTGTVL